LRRISAGVTSLLIALLILPASTFAEATPLDPPAVHNRIAQRGVGHTIHIEERTGVVLNGQIAAIGTDSFTLRVNGDSNPVNVKYVDVADFPRGGSHGRTIFLLSAIGAGAAFTIWGFVHLHNVEQQNQLPPAPTLPAFP
jgi:hypothetical protein